MSTQEIKVLLKENIDNIDDKEFLEFLNNLITEEDTESAPLKLTPEQERRIEKSIQGIERGEFFTNEEVEKMVSEWLKK
ncbi:MAG: hypothetical protein ABI723_15945 [Bacteroidia bacterium]